MNRIFGNKIFIFLFLVFSFGFAHAELVTSDEFGYSIDFPEGFEIQDMSEDQTIVVFSHSSLNLDVLLRAWPEGQFKNAKEAMNDTMKRLGAEFDTSEVEWRKQKCVVTNFKSAKLSERGISIGWGAGVPVPEKKGILTVLAYSPESQAFDTEQMMISVLDAIFIDKGSFSEPGLITTLAFPSEGKKDVALKIAGKSIKTTLDNVDSKASQFLIDREFDVFKYYAATKSPLMYDAWIRFYRLIARDSLGRLKKASFDIWSALQAESMKKDALNPDAALAQILLNWVQEFDYERVSAKTDKADFTNLPDVLAGRGSDCDSRSMLLAVILKNCGMDTCMFVSEIYSHAMFGICLSDKEGQKIKVDDKEYLVGETTAKNLTLGKIDAQMQDRSKWRAIEMY
ncbi:hypothetical protein [Treponema zioleckii]|uniref:hypothetical protein n=1 Tax=Treponema zioleckii TaxID=331680 RepID=UPI00168B007A|nr:hypothetical protein [Treponema zioleckii]